ncbi:UTP--glucose-1-phosphate uridylyltransferase [Cerasicoccus arenae]|uniref:UDP-N-acetylhexosamine pyrophosphorylase n=1 Tax=Cerasicoccus arenae TaxID=424488 RepID=A0A8J3DA92_9BACT|nr:UDPGP type 1 family protein [Cerasicoccus arenae]MBK1859204.1 UDPGP type 1 family protein [Cerasicoccus arenae]GHC01265.1 UDP-N-acetylhexosamine pyrophosphorylase [Cerasicoccus arenae]
MNTATAESLIDAFKQAGQGQVFRYWEKLDAEARKTLLTQALQIDLNEIARLNETLVLCEGEHGVDLSDLHPAPYIPRPEQGGDPQRWHTARCAGEEALRAGRVAAFTVAGGQGTRLGYDGPKGTFPVTPVRKATLFQVFAEKVLAARLRYETAIPWFLMTSNLNHEATVNFFEENDYFGLGADTVHFFQQGLMPAVDLEGKIMLADKGEIAMSPDGHGGSLRALVRSRSTEIMKAAGIDIISYFQVDNPLVRSIDPALIGFHIQSKSEMSSKMLPKAYPMEKVGHFCTQHGRTVVVEYSDMTDELVEQRTPAGELRFIAGSIAIHVLDREFVERMGGDNPDAALPFHRANKKVATLDDQGQPVKPETPNGVKFEMFVFDALPFAGHPVIIATTREEEFSPVKNAEGLDSPQTCCEAQLAEYTRWAQAAGVEIETNENGQPPFVFEVTPKFADNQESFVHRWMGFSPKPEISEGIVLDA